MGDFSKLEVWMLSQQLAIEVYKLTMEGPLRKDYSFRDQIRRAVISVPSNIVEGEESGFDKLGIKYFYNAKASLAELKTQLQIASKISYISPKRYSELQDKIELISKKNQKINRLSQGYS